MKIKALLGLMLVLQSAFLIFVLFTAPAPHAHLRIALEELKSGRVSNVAERITNLIGGYEFQTTLNLLFAGATLVISLLLIFFTRRAEKSGRLQDKRG